MAKAKKTKPAKKAKLVGAKRVRAKSRSGTVTARVTVKATAGAAPARAKSPAAPAATPPPVTVPPPAPAPTPTTTFKKTASDWTRKNRKALVLIPIVLALIGFIISNRVAIGDFCSRVMNTNEPKVRQAGGATSPTTVTPAGNGPRRQTVTTVEEMAKLVHNHYGPEYHAHYIGVVPESVRFMTPNIRYGNVVPGQLVPCPP